MQQSYAAICLISTHKVPRHGLDFRVTASLKSQWVRKRLVLCKEKTLRDEIRVTVIIDTRANCIAKKWAKKFQKMLKLSPKDKAPKTWKFRHLPLCAKGATLNHCELFRPICPFSFPATVLAELNAGKYQNGTSYTRVSAGIIGMCVHYSTSVSRKDSVRAKPFLVQEAQTDTSPQKAAFPSQMTVESPRQTRPKVLFEAFDRVHLHILFVAYL